jgi:hypothetical protein
LQDFICDAMALQRRQLLGIIEPFRQRSLRVQDDGSRHDRPGQSAPADFINSSDKLETTLSRLVFKRRADG